MRLTFAVAGTAALALSLAGCVGEITDIGGQLGDAYIPGAAVVHAAVTSHPDIDGERAVQLSVMTVDATQSGGEGEDVTLAPGDSIVAVDSGLRYSEGQELVIYLGRGIGEALRVFYALDPRTDLAAEGFGGAMEEGTPQVVILECIADAHGTEGPHRHEEALLADVLAPEGQGRFGPCLDEHLDWG